MVHLYPTGPYKLLVGEDICISSIQFKADHEMYYDGKRVMGLIHCRILPPRGEEHPFLITKINDVSVAVLCRSCAEKKSVAPCSHSPFDRSIADQWTITEVAYAISLNYIVLDWYELMIYEAAAPLLERYMALLAYHKIRFSPYPPHVRTEEEKSEYVESLNIDMCFQQRLGFSLDKTQMQPNEEMRSFFKQVSLLHSTVIFVFH